MKTEIRRVYHPTDVPQAYTGQWYMVTTDNIHVGYALTGYNGSTIYFFTNKVDELWCISIQPWRTGLGQEVASLIAADQST